MSTILKALAVLTFLAIASCSKDESDSLPEPANIWWYGRDTLSNAFTDVDTRTGYRIIFFPPGNAALDHYLTLQFSEFPHSGTTYQLTADSPQSGEVRVFLEAGIVPRYKSQTGGGSVNIGLLEEKFTFSADHLHLLRDTISATADALDLGFSLKAY